jgi:hypothetical protein
MRLQVLLIVAATLLLAGCGGKNANAKVTAAPHGSDSAAAPAVDPLTGHFEYAIGNMQGSKFLIINNSNHENNEDNENVVDNGVTEKKVDVKLAATYTVAYYAGKQYAVKYAGPQADKHKGEKNASYNEDSFHFGDHPGFVYDNLERNFYKHEGERAPGIVLLADAAFAKNYQLVPNFKYGKAGMVPSIKAEIQKKYNRKIVSSTVIATFGNGCEFDSFQFENAGTDALAICVLKTEKGCSIIEFPATYNDMSTWRVDDEGFFTISSNAANCIFKTAAGYTVFLEDLGEEGTSVYFLRQAGDKLVKENKASFVCLPN